MIIVHVESGLGNQMLNYAELLALKKVNPKQDIYIENCIYDISNKFDVGIKQWNGYELETVFGIKEKNIKDVVNYDEFLSYVIQTKFWENGWNFSENICKSLLKVGIQVENKVSYNSLFKMSNREKIIRKIIFETRLGNYFYRLYSRLFETKLIKDNSNILFSKVDGNAYFGQELKFYYKGYGIEKIEDELKEFFSFKNISLDKQNQEILNMENETNSVSIHVRRGDFKTNYYCYKYGYFKRAVKLIRKKIYNPTFYIFTDPMSVDWCKKNLKILGLKESDKIVFVNHNKSDKSYVDLFLMSRCKHNIITRSSFGWWASFLNPNVNKITISPDFKFNTKYWR